MKGGPAAVSGRLFMFHGKFLRISYETKTLREDAQKLYTIKNRGNTSKDFEEFVKKACIFGAFPL